MHARPDGAVRDRSAMTRTGQPTAPAPAALAPRPPGRRLWCRVCQWDGAAGGHCPECDGRCVTCVVIERPYDDPAHRHSYELYAVGGQVVHACSFCGHVLRRPG